LIKNRNGQCGTGAASGTSIKTATLLGGALTGKTIIAIAAAWWHSVAVDASSNIYTVRIIQCFTKMNSGEKAQRQRIR
jgi:predicted ribonuclease YlaK